jgi:D-sedoheptulose 7-phosphate isomerase
VCDLAKGTITEGVPRIRATCLTDNVPLLTAWANDTNYTNIFGEILKNHAVPGEVLVGCTASGQSPNIINAMRTARDLGAKTIALVGYDGGRVRDECDIALVIPSDNITQIEDVQTLLFHLIACALKEKMRGIRSDSPSGAAGL